MRVVHHIGLLILLLCFLSPVACMAQQRIYLPYHPQDTISVHTLALSRSQSLKKVFVVPDGVSKDYKKGYTALAEGLSENIYYTIRYRALLDTLIDPYVQGVFKKLIEANKDLPASRLIVVKNPVENAYAVGDGIILLNVGLLSKLENESQLAFVISHELAHIYFDHMQKGVKEHFDAFYNKEFQKEYRKIVKEEYNMNARLNSLVQNASLNKLYHKRTHEQQADSLGYELLSRAGYDAAQAFTALQLLDRIEEPFSTEEINFSAHFNCPELSYLLTEKPKKKASIFAVEAEKPKVFELSDTLKTHPDCKKRMDYIKALEKATPPLKANQQPDQAKFQYIRSISRYELIQSWYDAGYYDRAFFEALMLLQKDPANSYLQSIGILCLYELKEHLEHHRYADVVSKVSDAHPVNFNQFLERLHRLNLSDFKLLGSCFREVYSPADAPGEYSLGAAYAYQRLQNEHELAEKIKERYQQNYRQGRLKDSLFD